MRNRATNCGTCQSCGATQKLPGGRLAKHGYHIRWGFFSGICPGSGKLPYEQSCGLIQRYVATAKAQLADMETFRDSLLTPATEPKGWRAEWVSATGRERGGHREWRLTDLYLHEETRPDGYVYKALQYKDRQGDIRRLDYYGPDMSLLGAATYLNAARAGALVRESIQPLQEYVHWQERRIVEWVLRPLLPLA